MKNISEDRGNGFKSLTFRWELLLGFLIFTFVIAWAEWPLLSLKNDVFPVTADGMGHLAKIKYIADCFKDWQWPAWFPYWYNGSTGMQYYPPLSYLLLVPIQILFNNTMVTFKFFAFLSLFIGTVGVWYFCYRFIGPWVGIWGGVLYALQPFLIRLIFIHGEVAQGPVLALSPWFLFFTFVFFKMKSRTNWLILCLVFILLILTHFIYAFLVAIGVSILIISLYLFKIIEIDKLLMWFLAIIVSVGLSSFWWVSGASQIEMQGVSYLWVGWLGIGLSLLTLLITVLIYRNFNRFNELIETAVSRTRRFVESVGY